LLKKRRGREDAEKAGDVRGEFDWWEVTLRRTFRASFK